MSLPLFASDIIFSQRLLSCGGFYKGKLDGAYGPLTRAAEDAAQASYLNIQKLLGQFDPRSERAIITLLPAMQEKARLILNFGKTQLPNDLHVCLLSGSRTYAEQNVLYGKRPKVTNASGGHSNHNFGIAVDVGLFRGTHYLTGATNAEEKAYADLASIIKKHVNGLSWGGDWKNFKDAPHYQLDTGKTLDQVRGLFESGKSFT